MSWRRILGLFLVVGGALIPLAIAFRHPDMTNTRLFLTFWPEYLLDVVVMGIGVQFYREAWKP